MDAKLPEEFAPTGPKLSKFPIRPAPPIRPHLFPDEARFVLRLSLLCGGTEFIAWALLTRVGGRAPLLLAGLRLLKPLWARLGTRFPRPLIAAVLLLGMVSCLAANMFLYRRTGLHWPVLFAMAGLPAVADLAASCVGDSITVERRAAAYAWLDMAQGLGALLGLVAYPLCSLTGEVGPTVAIFLGATLVALLVASIGVVALHDRGTPRSSWPLTAYASVARSDLGLKLMALAFCCSALAMIAAREMPPPLWRGLQIIPLETLREIPPWLAIVLPIAGMIVAARIERLMPNAIKLPRAATGFAAIGLFLSFWPLGMFGLGMMFAAIPAAVARGAGEMERPLVSSLAWSALIAGAAVGSVL